ncbi:MAG: hypothetical protein QXM73_02500 [Candidatus Nezhaarchaeales archaeon]
MLRDLPYMLACSGKLDDYSTLCRALLALSTIALLLIIRWSSGGIVIEVTRLVLVFSFELYLASLAIGLRGVLAGLKLISLFAIIGALIFCVSYLVGWLAPDPIMLVPGMLRLVSLFLGFSLLFQLVSLQEWRSILSRLGLKSQSIILSMVLSQVPTIIHYLSEAITTVKLKYKGKRLHKVATPLALLSFLTSRALTESYLIYGLPTYSKLTRYKRRDLSLYSLFIVLILLEIMIGGLLPS